MLQICLATAALLVLARGVFHVVQSAHERTPRLTQLKRRGGYVQIGVALLFAAFAVGMAFVP